MKTETCKLYSRVLCIFLPNIIEIDPYNSELYRFKVGAFFETQCTSIHSSILWLGIIHIAIVFTSDFMTL